MAAETLALTVLTFVVKELAVPFVFEHGTTWSTARLRRWLQAGRSPAIPADDGLERAAHRAYLSATVSLGAACLRSFGKPERPELFGNRGYWTDEADSLYALRAECVRQLRALDSPRSEVPPLPGGAYQLPLVEQGADADPVGLTTALETALQTCLVEEMSVFRLPDAFHSRLRGGWEEALPGRTPAQVTWFGLLRSFFAQEVRENPALARALDAELRVILPEMALTLETLTSRFDDFTSSAAIHLQHILTGIDDVQQMLERVIDLQREPDSGRDSVYIGAQVEGLLHAYGTHTFVGRQSELAELDRLLVDNTSGCAVVSAPAGYGKTALLGRWIKNLEQRGCAVAHHFFSISTVAGGASVLTSGVEGHRNLARQLRAHCAPFLPRDALSTGLSEMIALVRSWPGRRPLVVVIDGLDEADSLLEPWVPDPLPLGVYVVVAGRAAHDYEPPFFDPWTQRSDARRLYLDRLNRDALADWLRQEQIAAAPQIVDELLSKTGGEPRYLHHVLAEIRARGDQDPLSILADVPEGFSRYVEQAIKRLRPVLSPEQHEVFVLLAIARGSLREDEIEAVLADVGGRGSDPLGFELLKDNWQAMRWVTERDGEDPEWSFGNHQEAEIFARRLRKRATAAAEQRLVSWCAGWRDHEATWRYPLRHYAEHLLRGVPERAEGEPLGPMPARDALYALAEDETFTARQLARLPDEPQSTLRTIQAALRAAARTDDAASMVRLLLRHYDQLERLRQSPLQALQQGDVTKARWLADLAPPPDVALWHLLLARSLMTGEPDKARSTLDHVRRLRLPSPTGWREHAALWLLAEVVELGSSAVLATEMFGEAAQVQLISTALDRVSAGAGPAARTVLLAVVALCRGLDDPEMGLVGLTTTAAAFSDAGLAADAAATLHEADGRIEADGTLSQEDWVQAHLSEAYARTGDHAAAADLASRVRQPALHLSTLLALARAAGADDPPLQDEALAVAGHIAQVRSAVWLWRSASADYALASLTPDPESHDADRAPVSDEQAWVSQIVAREGCAGLASIIEQTHLIDPRARIRLLIATAEQADRLGEPLLAAQAFGEAHRSAEAVVDLVQRVSACGDLLRASASGTADPDPALRLAWRTLSGIAEPDLYCASLLGLGEALSSVGPPSAVREVVDEAVRRSAGLADPRDRVRVLRQAAQLADPALRRRLVDDAVSVADSLPSDAERLAWRQAAAALPGATEGEEDEQLEDLLRSAEAASPETGVAHLVANAERLLTAGAYEKALLLATRAAALARPEESAGAVFVLGRIALIQFLAGGSEEAGRTMTSAQSLADAISDELERASAGCAMAHAYLDMGDHEAALGAGRPIANAELRVFTLWAVAVHLFEAGSVEQAQWLLEEALESCRLLADVNDRAGALTVVTDAFSSGRPFTEASARTRLVGWLDAQASGAVQNHLTRRFEPLPAGMVDALFKAFEARDRGDPEQSERLLAEAATLACDVRGPVSRASYLSVMGSLAQEWPAPWVVRLVVEACSAPAAPHPDLDAVVARLEAERLIRALGVASTDPARGTAFDEIREVQDPRRLARLLLLAVDLDPACRDRLSTLHRTLQGPPSESHVLSLMIIARSQMRAGLWDAADETWSAARSATAGLLKQSSTQAETGVATALRLAIDEAAQTPVDADSTETADQAAQERARCLTLVGTAQAAAGHPAESAVTFKEARGTVARVLDIDRKADLTGQVETLAESASGPHEGEDQATPTNSDETERAAPASDTGRTKPDPTFAEERVEVIVRRLTHARLQRRVDIPWALASIRSKPTVAAKPEGPGSVLEGSLEPTIHGTTQLASEAADGLGLGLGDGAEGVQQVMAAIQGSRDSLVSTDQTQQAVLAVGGRALLTAAVAMAAQGNRDGFEDYLVPCAYHADIGAELLSLLAEVYPTQSGSIVAELEAAASTESATSEPWASPVLGAPSALVPASG